jgi:hypothetical protein
MRPAHHIRPYASCMHTIKLGGGLSRPRCAWDGCSGDKRRLVDLLIKHTSQHKPQAFCPARPSSLACVTWACNAHSGGKVRTPLPIVHIGRLQPFIATAFPTSRTSNNASGRDSPRAPSRALLPWPGLVAYRWRAALLPLHSRTAAHGSS